MIHVTYIGCFSDVCDIESFIEKLGQEALSCRDEWGYTPAHWAALDGNVEVMRYLVERCAPVDLSCLGTQGPRPIHWACRKGHTAVVQVLLSVRNYNNPFEVNKTQFNEWSPLGCFAVLVNVSDILKYSQSESSSWRTGFSRST